MKRVGHFWDPPDMKRPRDRGGSQDGMGPRSVCPLEAPPLRVVRMGAGERRLSPSQAKKNGSRTECRSTAVALCGGAISSCRVAQNNRGGGPFCVRYWSCRLLSIRPAVSRVSNHAAGMNIDDACTEKGMCSVAYSSTTHRPYTDEHTTQLYQISYHHRGAEQA